MTDNKLMLSLKHWLSRQLSVNIKDFFLVPLKGDASFRRYYRVKLKNITYIAAYSPPASENNAGFLTVGRAFLALDIIVPHIIADDLSKGYLLLSDLGNQVFGDYIAQPEAYYKRLPDPAYKLALKELGKIQRCDLKLPLFDKTFMQTELENFVYWYLEIHLKLILSVRDRKKLNQAFEFILNSAVNQPQCCIHRDYHSRNLMILAQDNTIKLGILDFQDAMIGPVTYDLISLIRDCYIDWPESQVQHWALSFYEQYLQAVITNPEMFLYYMDLMGIQRHLKAIFIFARKFHRDNVNIYLEYIPRALKYILTIGKKYPELNDLCEILHKTALT